MVLFISYLFPILLIFSPATKEQHQFFKTLRAQNDKSYTGVTTISPANDTKFAGKTLRLFIQKATNDSIRIPFWVGEDTSLTLHKNQGLLVKHDHRHPDGTPEAITMYGGYATTNGTALSQSFPADAFTEQLRTDKAAMEWAMQLSPDKKHLTYTLQVNNILVYQFDFKLD